MNKIGSRFVTVVAFMIALAIAIFWLSDRHRSTFDETALQQRVNEIAAQLRAPEDHNSMTVATSPIPQAERMRYSIQQDVLKGLSDKQIIEAMEARYGSSVLAAPRFEGLGAWAWLMPCIVVLFGVLIYGWYMKRKTRRNNGSMIHQDSQSAMDPDVIKRLKDYL